MSAILGLLRELGACVTEGRSEGHRCYRRALAGGRFYRMTPDDPLYHVPNAQERIAAQMRLGFSLVEARRIVAIASGIFPRGPVFLTDEEVAELQRELREAQESPIRRLWHRWRLR